jgi:crotonobetainyl-CoA hydratase
MLISGRRMSANEAKTWGIVNQLTTSDELMIAARQLAEKICLSAPLSVAAVLELIRELETVATDDAMSVLRNNQTYRSAIESQDAAEGTKAFAEKRAPKWLGK